MRAADVGLGAAVRLVAGVPRSTSAARPALPSRPAVRADGTVTSNLRSPLTRVGGGRTRCPEAHPPDGGRCLGRYPSWIAFRRASPASTARGGRTASITGCRDRQDAGAGAGPRAGRSGSASPAPRSGSPNRLIGRPRAGSGPWKADQTLGTSPSPPIGSGVSLTTSDLLGQIGGRPGPPSPAARCPGTHRRGRVGMPGGPPPASGRGSRAAPACGSRAGSRPRSRSPP